MGWLDRLLDRSEPEIAEGEHEPASDGSGEPGTDRRSLEAATAERQITDSIAAKLLHGWLQNRQQVLVPLSVNIARLPAEHRPAIARFAALAGAASGGAGTPEALGRWLAENGADPAFLALFEEAAGSPPGLPAVMAEVAAADLAGLAFVIALVAARTGGRAGTLFADYVAARLALSSAAVRSAERRYRI